MEQKKLDRINELARKAKVTTLTESEKDEQAILRKEYIDLYKKNMRQSLDMIKFDDSKK